MLIRVLSIIGMACALGLAGAGWLRLRRRAGRGRMIGFLDYVRNPRLRSQVADIFERRDAEVQRMAATIPPEDLVANLASDDPHEYSVRAINALGARAEASLLAALDIPAFREPYALGHQHCLDYRRDGATPVEAVLSCLFDNPPSKASGSLLRLAEDSKSEIRSGAARVIGATGDAASLGSLTRLLKDPDDSVCRDAVTGIRQAIEAGQTVPEFRRQVFELLIPTLDAKGYRVVQEAAECLLELDRERAIGVLTSDAMLNADRECLMGTVSALREKQVVVPAAALRRLTEELGPRAEEYFPQRALSEALLLLAGGGDALARGAIEPFMTAPQERVREAAAEALARLEGVQNVSDLCIDLCREVGWERLSEAQRNFASVEELISEVANGGFAQYFVNSAGDHWQDALRGLKAIGLGRDGGLLAAAIARFGAQGPSTDSDKRHSQLARIMKGDERAFADIEQAFHNDEECRRVLMFQYVARNAAEFRPRE